VFLYVAGRRYNQTVFRFDNLREDWVQPIIDINTGLGAFGYFAGGIFFLVTVEVNGEDLNAGAVFFVLGGLFFTIAGLCMFYRYFVTKPHL
jgi:hypothetical protein